MTNPFKVGDRVRRTAEDSPGGTSNKGQEHVIKTVVESVTLHDKEKFGPYKFTFEGQLNPDSFYYSKNYELVTPAVKTDEELAAEYREFDAKGREIGLELERRGYYRQWKAPHRGVHNWKDFVRLGPQSDIVRFMKTETVTEMQPVTKTVTKEI